VGKAIHLGGTNAILKKYEAYSQAHFILIQAQHERLKTFYKYADTQRRQMFRVSSSHGILVCLFVNFYFFIFSCVIESLHI